MSAPQHSATAPIRFIHVSDEAWDLDTAERELGAMDDDAKDGHPLRRYLQGKTRYDIEAPAETPKGLKSPRDYLKPGVEPVTWALRRLKIVELTRCRDLGGRAGQLEAFRLAFEGVRPERCKVPEGIARMQDKALQDLVDAYGANVIWDVGEGAMLAAAAPTEQEKKL